MATNVVMPQMGESIAEGTIVRWIKKVGDNITRDEPLFEISTDKVDAEIPSPAAGVLSEIRAKEGETVPVDSVVAVIAQPGEAAAQPGAPSATPAAVPPPPAASTARAGERPATTPSEAATPVETAVREPAAAEREEEEEEEEEGCGRGREAAGVEAPAGREPAPAVPREPTKEELRRQKSSPLVRRIAREHDIDISQIRGTGIGGRVTKDDILGYIDKSGAAPLPVPAQARPAAPSGPAHAERPGDRVDIVRMSVMRKKIAEHMVLSRRTSAHVHSVFEVDFTRVARVREAKKSEFERAGVKLTYLSFIARAAVEALRAFPLVNASLDGDNIVYKKAINLGIAVALDWGLIVPVIKNADEKNVLGLSRAIADLAERARTKQLKPEDVQGGTFTITNPGVFGALFGMPIINQPQVAILGVGAVEKRPVVIEDAIAIRQRAYLTLGYDHRLIDGAVADQFMSHLKTQIESFELASL
ncbi:MAG: 2-oxo acid dehydrogenase subunit E2 [Acidobacteria bacterium]|nr:2-oxo acid dehydrogenase subunit E2 [Acidobacteriota bacterium]